MRVASLLLLACEVSGYRPGGLAVHHSVAAKSEQLRTAPVTMINLFGNNEESVERRKALSYREARPGDRKVAFRKPNTATEGLMLGLKFKEAPFTKAVFIEKILPNTEAERLQKAGQIRVGDEVVMVSATFGDEMWSARGVGKYRLEKSIAVRQGMTISFVFENSDDNSKKRKQEMAKQASKEAERMTRLQRQLTKEVEQEKKKGWSLFG